jgi:NADH-quinone oxidoreductase subunit C
MSTTETMQRVSAALEGIAHRALAPRDGMAALEIEARDAREVLRRLRDRAGFDTNTFVTAIDRYPAEPRFQVVWQFLSLQHNDRVRVQALLPGDAPRVASVGDLWPGTRYSERECFDMFGIVFEGHAGLKRLLMPEGYEHHPLRKDFPHQGIEPDRLYREWDRRRRERSPIRTESEA